MTFRWASLFEKRRAPVDRVSSLQSLAVCRTFDEYVAFLERSAELTAQISAFETDVFADRPSVFARRCAVCDADVDFAVDYPADDAQAINLRETLICPRCGMNNRGRLATHFLLSRGVGRSDRIYLTEQTSALYQTYKKRFPSVVGSEYLPGGASGAYDERGLRHEDITHLSFEDATLDYVCTFDVLEHVPDYVGGLRECVRCLRAGGGLIMTVPFSASDETTQIRARVRPDGTIEHLRPAMYHGDPLSSEGILCFQIFGWDLIEQLRDLGLEDVALHFFWSAELAYLGGLQFVIFGTQPRRKTRPGVAGDRSDSRPRQMVQLRPSAKRTVAPMS